MRFLLALIGIAAVIVVAMVSLGLLSFQTRPGTLPSVHVDGGTAPAVSANVAKLSVGTEDKVVDVPTVGTTQKTIAVPTIHMTKPGDGTSNASAE